MVIVIHPQCRTIKIVLFMVGNKSHGGKREGAGRPKLPRSQKKEKTKVMRIPLSLVETVEKLIEDYNEFVKPNNTK